MKEYAMSTRVSGMIKALDTCPYCGNEAYTDLESMAILGARTGHKYAVACTSCEASAPGAGTPTEAYANWNLRAPRAAIQPDPEPQPVATGRGRIVGSTTWTSKPLPEIKSSAGTVSVEAALRMADETFRDLGWHAKWEVTTAALRALVGEGER